MKQTTDMAMVSPPRLTESEFRRWLEQFHGVNRVRHDESVASVSSEMDALFGRTPTSDGQRPNVYAWWDNGRGRRHRYILETRLGVTADDVVRWLVDAWARKKAYLSPTAAPPDLPESDQWSGVNGVDPAQPSDAHPRPAESISMVASVPSTVAEAVEPRQAEQTPASIAPPDVTEARANGQRRSPLRRRTRAVQRRPISVRPSPVRRSLVDQVYWFVAGRSMVRNWRVRWLDRRRLEQRFGPAGQAAYRRLVRQTVIIEAVHWDRSLVLIIVSPPAFR